MIDATSRWHLGLSQNCNMRCTYCATAFGTYGLTNGLLAREDWPRFFELVYSRLPADGQVQVECGGGETFVYYDEFLCFYDRLLEFGSNRGFRPTVSVQTNGSLLDEERIDELQAREVSLLFSIDGPAAAHDHHRVTLEGQGTHARALENWRYYVRGMPPMERNQTVASVYSGVVDLDRLSAFWLDEGVAVYQCMVRLPKFRSYGQERAAWLALQQRYLVELQGLAERYVKVGFPRVFEVYSGPADLYGFWRDLFGGASRESCGAGNSTLGVSADGRIFPCSAYTGTEFFGLGDLRGGLDRAATARYLAEIGRARDLCVACDIREICPKCCFGQYADRSPAENVLDGCGFAKAVTAIAVESWREMFAVFSAE